MNLPISLSALNDPGAISALTVFFLICCAFAAQYWAYRCYQQLKLVNEKIDRLLVGKGK